MRRPRVLGTSRLSDFLRTATDAAGVPADCTSDARISPPGPEPCRVARSTPNSFARRRAFGEILAFRAGEDSDATAAIGAAWVSLHPCAPARAVGAAVADSFSVGGFSPGATIQAMV